MVTDADGSTVDIIVNARRNDPPTAPQPAAVIVGTQAPATVPATTPACPEANECVATIEFTDNDAMEMLTFTDDSADEAKVVVVSSTPEANTMAKVVLRGIASTWVADTRPVAIVGGAPEPGHKPVTVTVTAMDRGLLPVKATLNVTVDGAPTADTLPGGTVSQGATTSTYEFDASGFFKDPEGEILALTVAVSEATGRYASATIVDGTVTVTRKAPGGTAEITVTATEATGGDTPVQSVKATFNVVVN